MTPKSSGTLAALIRRCRAGDREAWGQLIDLVSPLIFSICRRMKLSREESFDIFGQVCYLLLRNINRLRESEKLLAYVGTMTRREIYALHRKSRLLECLDVEKQTGSIVKTETTPEKIYERTERSERLMEALVMLPERDHKLLRLLFFDQAEPDYEEASKVLGMPVASVGPTRARSLARLQKILKKKRYQF